MPVGYWQGRIGDMGTLEAGTYVIGALCCAYNKQEDLEAAGFTVSIERHGDVWFVTAK